MKKVILHSIIVSIIISGCAQQQQNEFPFLKGPYLGQKPPDTIPVIFAPGIVSTGLYTRDIAITKDGKEIYF